MESGAIMMRLQDSLAKSAESSRQMLATGKLILWSAKNNDRPRDHAAVRP